MPFILRPYTGENPLKCPQELYEMILILGNYFSFKWVPKNKNKRYSYHGYKHFSKLL